MPARIMSRRDMVALCLAAVLHIAALIVMAATEADWVASAAFLLSWALLNFFWLALVRRPIVAALLSLELIVALTLLSRFKFDKLWMTVDFVDVMIIDRDTSAFLLTVLPALRGWLALTAAATAALLIAAWRLDPNRVRVRSSLVGGALCMAALVVLSLSFPTDLQEDFISQNYVSKFARTGVEAIHELATHGYLESDAAVTGGLKLAPAAACQPARKLPHIILLHDELSFDITVAPGIKVPAGYQHHFESLDGKARKLDRRGRRRTKLVHRVQCAHRPFGPFLRTFRDVRHPDRRGTPQSRSAAVIEPLWLQDLQPLSVLWCFSRFACLPDVGRHRELSGHGRPRHP